MKDIVIKVKRRLKLRSHQSRGYHNDGHTLADVNGETNLITPYKAGSTTTQDSQLVNASKVQPTCGSSGAQCAGKGDNESIKEGNSASERSGTPVSAQKRSTNVERNNLTTSNHTEKSDSPLVNEPSKQLVDQLSQAMKESAFKENRLYIPDGLLDSLICRSTVREELRLAYDENRKPWRKVLDARETYQLASLICPRRGLQFMSAPLALGPQPRKPRRLEYRKIFAILLLVGKEKEVPIFVKHRVSDQELPLIPMKVSDEERWLFSGQSKPDEILHCFRSWNATAIHQFEQQQWRVLAPVFKDPENEGIFQRDLDVACVLPFFEWTCCAKGRTACVYRAMIHPNHHTFSRNRKHGNVFAVKQLLHHRNIGSQDAGLQYEINVLEGILKPQHQHDHLINMLATFRIDGIDYIIFPWAETDLLNYWRWKNPDPTPSRRTVKWLLEQCHGLACALHNIHRWPTTRSSKLFNAASSSGNGSGESEPVELFGRHGDIKPMNILWFDDGGLGTLKLADFGTARFDAERTPPPVNLDLATTPNYRAPEFRPDTAVSVSWDIWALGCVYLEFVTWLWKGWKGVNTFADSRLAEDPHHEFRTTTFYELGADDVVPRLKPVVLEHLDKLSSEVTYPAVLKLFLDYIMEKMVIVEDQNVKRSNATDLMRRTEEILGAFAKVTKRESRMGRVSDLHFLWVD